MERPFVNFTNHLSSRWGEKQKEEALKYGPIKDIPFPPVDPEGDEAYIGKLAEAYAERIMKLCPAAVLCQGEFCLAYQIVKRLTEERILVLAACSKRIVKENGQKKEVIFEFSRFRRFE